MIQAELKQMVLDTKQWLPVGHRRLVAHVCTLSSGETEGGGVLRAWSETKLYDERQASLGHSKL